MERVSVLCLLLLLCSLSGAELQDNEIIEQRKVSPESVNVPEPQPCPSDLHAVLREMTATLAVLQTKMETLNQLQVKVEQLQTLNVEIKVGSATISKDERECVSECKCGTAHSDKLREVDVLKQQQRAQAAEVTSIKTWANVTEDHVASLRRDRAVGQVAFSASLMTSGSGFTGPYNVHTPLIFRHVFTNTGNAYNPNTGFFIAPVKGAYHFEFYIGSYSDDYHRSAAGLVKNGEHVVIAHERGPNGHSSAANGATLLLEPGDVVFVRLWHNNNIYDDLFHYTSFSGHLLFPM